MNNGFLAQLPENERTILLRTPVLIAFLVAGADNNFDENEREWAQRLVELRSLRNEKELVEYYNLLDREWDEIFESYGKIVVKYDDPEFRNKYLSELIAEANPVLAGIDAELAASLYNSFRTFARQIAQASGGFLGFGAISPEEYRWVDLEMLEKPAHA